MRWWGHAINLMMITTDYNDVDEVSGVALMIINLEKLKLQKYSPNRDNDTEKNIIVTHFLLS